MSCDLESCRTFISGSGYTTFMQSTAAYSGWIGHRNIGDEAIWLSVADLFPDLKLSDINHVPRQNIVIYGGGTIFPSAVSRQSEYRDNAFTIAIGVGVRSPNFWNQKFSLLDVGYYTGSAVNSSRNTQFDNQLYAATKFFDSFWEYNKTLTDKDFEAVRDADINFIGIRGPLSSELLSRYDIEHEVVGDTALNLEPPSYYPESQNRVAVTIRDNTYGWASNDYHETIVEFCRRNADDYDFVFLPFWPPDIEVCHDAAQRVPGATYKDYCSYVNVNGVLDEIAQCDLMIGDKLHANVLSACTHTPFFSLEYRPKNRDFAESVEMGEYNVRTDEVTVEWLQNRFNKAMSSGSIQDALERNVRKKRESLAEFSYKISDKLRAFRL